MSLTRLVKQGLAERLRFAASTAAQTTSALLSDQRGALTSEYVILVGTVGLLIVGALVSLGPQLVSSYERSRAILIGPFP